VERCGGVVGPLLILGVVLLTGSVVGIVYWIGQPYYAAQHPHVYPALMLVGHWLLLNVCFHYTMACVTSPGYPHTVSQAVTVCKKCIGPKPPRTHHCSVCDRCVLKMDHHCPWIHNCVGHLNHRFFFLYMVYMILGCLFIMLFGFEICVQEIWLGGDGYGPALKDTVYRFFGFTEEVEEGSEEVKGYPVRGNSTHLYRVIENGVEGETLVDLALEAEQTEELRRQSYWRRFALTYAGLLTVGALVSLTALTAWHARLIGRAETSVEQLINAAETRRLAQLGQTYHNPYDFGKRHNWRVFLGIQRGSGRSFWRHVMLPSRHPPLGDGLSWPSRYWGDPPDRTL